MPCSTPTVEWSDVNTSMLINGIMDIHKGSNVLPECIRAAATYLPVCLPDLHIKEGCCALACRTAILSVSSLGRYLV